MLLFSKKKNGQSVDRWHFSYICIMKLRKECNLLEMSIGQSLIIVIGYELVSYLLHYSSVRCVTFKELFVCKSNNKTGD